jgi:hypothetical protein
MKYGPTLDVSGALPLADPTYVLRLPCSFLFTVYPPPTVTHAAPHPPPLAAPPFGTPP